MTLEYATVKNNMNISMLPTCHLVSKGSAKKLNKVNGNHYLSDCNSGQIAMLHVKYCTWLQSSSVQQLTLVQSDCACIVWRIKIK